MKRKKSVVSILLVVCLIITMLPLSIGSASAASISETEFANKISYLKTVYRDQEYWNGYNACGYDGTGSRKCYCSGSCAGSCSCKCGKFYYNGSYVGGQCYGFANKMAYLIFGSVPELHWTKYTSVSNYYAGDYVRVRSNRHSIFITKVSNGTVTYVDCNNYGPCQVKWDRTISVSSLKSITTYVRHLSGNDLTGTGYIPPVVPDPDPVITVEWNTDNRYPTPITAYPSATSGKISVFNANLTEYSQSTRYISANDLCTINNVYTNGYCSVTYPTSNGSHTEYARTSDFIPNSVTPFGWSPSSNTTSYVRSDMGIEFGSVFASDSCTVVGRVGETKLQVIYPVSGGYKLGWVYDNTIPPIPSDFPTPLIGYIASSDTRATVYESLSTMGTYYGQLFVDDRCTLNTVSVSGGWVHVTYPVNGGTKSGYVYLNDFVPSSSKLTTFYTTTVTQQTDTFRKPDMAISYGWVSVGDQITVVGKSGNKLQVLYPVDTEYGGGFKLAWIYDTYIKKNLTGLSIGSNPSKSEYIEGENLSINGLVVNAHYDDGSTANVTGSCSFSGYSSTPGVKTITASYDGKQTAFTVTVNSKSPTSLTIKTLPNKTTYEIGEEIDMTGLTGQVSFDNGTSEDLSDSDILYDDNITSTAGEKEIIVSCVYNEKSVQSRFYITVLASTPTNPTEPTNPTTPTNPINPDDATFKVSNVLCKSGDTINVDVAIENNPAITSLKIKLDYPANVLTLTGVEYKELFSTRATGTNRYESPFTISWFSTSSVNENANGVLATLTFTVAQDAAEDIYPITLTYDPDDVFDSNFDNKEFAVVNGEIIVSNSIPGDVNGDRKVNMKDIVLLQQYLNGWSVNIDMIAANVNGDTKVNMKDIVLLQQYLNGWEVALK